MPSSISSSEQSTGRAPAYRLTAIVLLGIILFTLVGLELFARLVVERRSKVQRMVNAEYQEAIRVRRSGGASDKQLLVVGNSLVGHSIDFDELQRDLPPGWQARRFWIYNTNYDDWYFGLRRLFADGSRPDVLAVVFAGLNWYASGVRGDYSAQYLFRARDLREVQARLDLSPTIVSSLLFAHFSKFFALRSEVRKVLLEQLIPDLPQMNALFKPGASRQLSDRQVIELVRPRISAYRDIAREYGARLVLLVPPIGRPQEEHQKAMRTAAEQAGVPIFMPLSSANVAPREFEDDMHLNPAGAQRFTAALMRDLNPVLTLIKGN